MAAKDNAILDRGFLDRMWFDVDDVKPPPPPPGPFLEDPIAKLLPSGIALSLTFAVAHSFLNTTGVAEGIARGGIVRWMIIGFVLGAIFGGVGSVIYNAILRNSRGIKAFRNAYPEAKDLHHDALLRYWIENRFGYFYLYMNEKFAEKPPPNP